MLSEHQSRILDRSEPVPHAGCWIWTATSGRNGYGRDSIGTAKYIEAHRSAYTAFKGEIPAGMCVCHKCDTPLCVNPDHLFLGTHAENMRDMYHKGRGRYGRSSGVNKGYCVNGHRLVGENVYDYKGKSICRRCNLDACKRYYAKKKAERLAGGAA